MSSSSPVPASASLPHLGFGLGLRPTHYPYIFEHRPKVDWFEIISENFMDTDGRPKRNLMRIRERYPIVMHGVALSIGTVDPLNSEYLAKLKALIQLVEPAWVSDHICWTGIAHKNTHDLLPVPYTQEALGHLVDRIGQVQDFLKRPLTLENPSTYLEFKSSEIPEAEFIAQMIARSGCNLLLDVNNVYVSCYNHRLDAKNYIDALPLERVQQIHLSGHSNYGTHIIDTHDDFVVDEVWALYRYIVNRANRTPNTMVEWDDKIPEFTVLMGELDKAKSAARRAQDIATFPQFAAARIPYVANRLTPLAQEQSRLQQAILSGSEESAGSWIREKPEFSAAAQLAVYTNAYRLRLRDSTAEDFPVLQHYLGNEAFQILLRDFVEACTSNHFNIARYSPQLVAFVNDTYPHDRFAQELALLENAVAQLGDPAETAALTPTHLATLNLENIEALVLKPRLALQLFHFQHTVNDYFQAVMNGAKPDAAPIQTYLAVFRHEDSVWRMALDANEYYLLKQIFGGATIGEAIDHVRESFTLNEDELSANLTQWFGRWIRNGLLAA